MKKHITIRLQDGYVLVMSNKVTKKTKFSAVVDKVVEAGLKALGWIK